MPIPRPFEYPKPKPKPPVEPPKVETIDVTVLEIGMTGGTVSIVLTDDDAFEHVDNIAVKVNLKANPKIGRKNDEEVLYYMQHVMFISQQNTKLEVKAEGFTPPSAAPSEGDQ